MMNETQLKQLIYQAFPDPTVDHENIFAYMVNHPDLANEFVERSLSRLLVPSIEVEKYTAELFLNRFPTMKLAEVYLWLMRLRDKPQSVLPLLDRVFKGKH